jgi:hypothetical protein
MDYRKYNGVWIKLESITEAIEARRMLAFECLDKDLGRLRGFKVECTPININHNYVCTLTSSIEDKDYLLWRNVQN